MDFRSIRNSVFVADGKATLGRLLSKLSRTQGAHEYSTRYKAINTQHIY